MDRPSIYAYLDYRTYLNDWVTARKKADPSYSYATFGAAGGCSKSTLANVISGARIPRARTLDNFAQAMALSPSERNYLGLLVDLAHAPDLATRRTVMDRILSAERFHQLRLAESVRDADVFRYLQHWYVPVIREMAGLEGFRPEPEWIARHLRPTITPEEAAEALETLLELEFLVRQDDGSVVPAELRFRTEPETRQRATAHYHREVVPSLLREIDSDLGNEQHLLAATLALPKSLVPEAKARLSALVEQLATLSDDQAHEEQRRVYQLAIQLLPVCEKLS